MKRLSSAVVNDLKLQYRHKFYHVYAIITTIYIVILRLLPAGVVDLLLPVLIFSDPAMLGFYLVAAMVLFEKDAKSLQGISVSPLLPWEYVLAKAISLSTLSVLASLVLALGVRGLSVQWPLLIVGVGLTAMAYVTIGFVITVRHESFNTFLLESILAVTILNLPLLAVFGMVNSRWFYLLPAHPAIQVIIHSFQAGPGMRRVVSSLILLLLWNIALLSVANRQYVRYIKGDQE
jgi:fluoroquinolone transport system permease protein